MDKLPLVMCLPDPGRRPFCDAARSRRLSARSACDSRTPGHSLTRRGRRTRPHRSPACSRPEEWIVARQHYWLYKNGPAFGMMPGALWPKVKAEDSWISARCLEWSAHWSTTDASSTIEINGRNQVMNFRMMTSLAGRDVFHYRRRTRLASSRTACAPSAASPTACRAIRLRTSEPRSQAALDRQKAPARSSACPEERRRFSAIHFSDGWINHPPAVNSGAENSGCPRTEHLYPAGPKGQVKIVKPSKPWQRKS